MTWQVQIHVDKHHWMCILWVIYHEVHIAKPQKTKKLGNVLENRATSIDLIGEDEA